MQHNDAAEIYGVPALAFEEQSNPYPTALMTLLLAAYVFNYLDRQIVNILAEPIARDLQLSDTQIGLVTGVAFVMFYAVMGLPIARLVDAPRTNRIGVIAFSLFFWSGMTAACGAARSFTAFFIARMGVGLGEAGLVPAAHSLIMSSVPPARRGASIGLFGLGVPIGMFLGLATGGIVADLYGWRVAFFLVALPGLLLAPTMWFMLKDPRFASPRSDPSLAEEKRIGFFASLRVVGRSRAYLMLLLSVGSLGFFSYGNLVWTPIFMIRTLGASPGEAGLWLGIAYGTAGAIGTWLGGVACDKFGSRDPRHYFTLTVVGLAGSVPLLIMAYWVADWRISIALIWLPAVLLQTFYAPTFFCAQRLLPAGQRAFGTATVLLANSVAGIGLGPLFFGMLSDELKTSFGADSIRIVLSIAALISLIPATSYWITGRLVKDNLHD